MADRLWWFFKLFPETFRCHEPVGDQPRMVTGIWRSYKPEACATIDPVSPWPHTHKPWPYTHAGWREVGVTSHMLIRLAEQLKRPIYVIHNDHKIYQNVPKDWTPHDPTRTAIVYAI